MRKFMLKICLFTIFAAVLPGSSRARTIVWTAADANDSKNWHNPLNWDTNKVPGREDDVLIDIMYPCYISAPAEANSVTIGGMGGTMLNIWYSGSLDANDVVLGRNMLEHGGLCVFSTGKLNVTRSMILGIHGDASLDVFGGYARVAGRFESRGIISVPYGVVVAKYGIRTYGSAYTICRNGIITGMGYIEADLNQDGRVDFRDFAMFAENWMSEAP